MEYNVFVKVTANGKTTKSVYSYEDELNAKRAYHQQLGAAYATEGMTFVLARLFNDLGGDYAKEYYQEPEPEPESV